MTEVIQEAIEKATSAYAEKQEEIIKEALREGYNGVDFINDVGGGFSMSMKYKKWDTPPQYHHPSGIQRYDFRYYDRENLTHLAECGEFPE